ncbi:MAG: methylated-DNA--[protein]-cysteine S-methyltransferase [Solirubrobacterales bacterium]
MTELAELKSRVVARADDDGLLDVAYTRTDSPLGELLLAATPRGLVTVGFPSQDADLVLGRLAAEVSPRVLERPARLDEARRELDQYFEGRRRRFDVEVDFSLSHGFRRQVLVETARIPFGETSTYAQVAASAGSPRAHRAAGSALGSNPVPIVVPCHRVLRSGGALGGYAGGLEVKQRLLDLEGVGQRG